jgi:hypothetical protein
MQAATQLLVDSICMDCEDGVALNMKQAARENIARMLEGEQPDKQRKKQTLKVWQPQWSIPGRGCLRFPVISDSNGI